MIAEFEEQMRLEAEAQAEAEAQLAAIGAAARASMEADDGPGRGRSAVLEIDPEDPSTWGKVGRNAPCPCGSGKKYKHCHGRVNA